MSFLAANLQLKFQKYGIFDYFRTNLETFFFKMTFWPQIAQKSLKNNFRSLEMIFIHFWIIFNKLKFWFFENFLRKNPTYNSEVTWAGFWSLYCHFSAKNQILNPVSATAFCSTRKACFNGRILKVKPKICLSGSNFSSIFFLILVASFVCQPKQNLKS
jgi:hypothetical protein